MTMSKDTAPLPVAGAPAGSSIATDGAAVVAWRLLAGLIGGYGVVSGLIALSGSALPFAGLARGEAVSLGIMTGFILYPALVCWLIATRKPWRNGGFLIVLGGVLVLSAQLI